MKKTIFTLLILSSLILAGCDLESSNTYTDVNYAFSVDYPLDFQYEIIDQDVIFSNQMRDMYYVSSVLLNTNTGGVFNTLQEVQNDYLSQFSSYEVNLEGSVEGKIDGFDSIDFAISYVVDGTPYINRFIVGKDAKYFYVLQFIVPASQYEDEEILVGQIIETFTFGEDDSTKKGIVGGQFDSPSESSGTTTPSTTPIVPTEEPITPVIIPEEEPIELEETPEECYNQYRHLVDDARENNALQDPTTSGLSYMYVGLIDSCSSAFETCLAAGQAKEDDCWNPAPGSGDANLACMTQNKYDTLACAEVEIACHESYYKSECGLTSGTTTTTTTSVSVSATEAEECYSWYDQHFVSLRDQHASQDPYSSSIGLPYDNTEECWTVVGDCNTEAEEAYDACWDSPTDNTVCSTQENIAKLSCVMLSIECGEDYHKTNCGLI